MRSFKSNENIHKKEGGPYYVVSANKASSLKLPLCMEPEFQVTYLMQFSHTLMFTKQ